MAQNLHNAVIHLGHQNGTVTLWTPNLPHPAVRLLAHLGPVVGVSVDPSTGGRYMATAGHDGTVKVWDCRNWKGAVRQWPTRGGSTELEWSQKGMLAVASGGSVNVNVSTQSLENPANSRFARYTTNRPFSNSLLESRARRSTRRTRSLTGQSHPSDSVHSRMFSRLETQRVSRAFSSLALVNQTSTVLKLIHSRTRE